MTDFEDHLRADLARRADAVSVSPEAWDINQRLVSRRGPVTRFWPALVAAAVIAVVAGTVLVVRNDRVSGPASPPSTDNLPASTMSSAPTIVPTECPAELQRPEDSTKGPWVPAAPTREIDRLLPDEIPVSVVTCTYTFSTTGNSGPAAGVIGGDLAAMVDEIRYWPTALPGQARPYVCAAVGQSKTQSVLYAFTYGDGSTVWLGADTQICTNLGNGDQFSYVLGSGQLVQSAAAGRWIPKDEIIGECPSTDACIDVSGRWGQQQDMVPPGATGVEVSRSDSPGPPTASGEATADERLVDALNAFSTAPSPRSCTPRDPALSSHRYYIARFSYPQGPEVMVLINESCGPFFSNGSLSGGDAGDLDTILPMLDQIVDG
ncbi:hypothetical protein GIS00_20025 [Nakamurella sp. YIM 132087]|uniref:Uncharacterized protein n=1 Tax=Nakamurella alba TaxID=2665158 RepID=A0A7K1FQ82_9ACTN|nr:hypothetical protein [Nakamurella alba]MTD16230.1 hypothetical protein [Nakamurella alba]